LFGIYQNYPARQFVYEAQMMLLPAAGRFAPHWPKIKPELRQNTRAGKSGQGKSIRRVKTFWGEQHCGSYLGKEGSFK
jgi:hypothetical protein